MSDIDEDQLLETLEETNQTLEKEPENVKALLTHGQTCFKLDEFETALKSLKKGLALAKKSCKGEETTLASKFDMWIRKCNTNLEGDTQVETKPGAAAVEPATNGASSPPAAAAAEQPVRKSPVRHEWYQTPKEVVVTFFAKKREDKHVKVSFQPNSLEVVIELNDSSEFQHSIDPLYKDIIPGSSSWKITPYKLEVTLRKKDEKLQWKKLEGSDEEETGDGVTMNDSNASRPSYPSSSKKKTDWDKLNADEKKAEEDEKPEGDAALTKLFQQIYGNADDDTKRAMQKSYVESGGTVLSTNWDEIGAKKTEATPPQGMEWASWDKRAQATKEQNHYEKPADDDNDGFR